MQQLMNATGFKRALTLARTGEWDQCRSLLKSLQDDYLALCEENEALKRQMSEVADVLDLAETMVFDGQKYWIDEDGSREGPFCQLCYDRDGLLVRLGENEKHFNCRNCGNLYMKPRLKKTVRKDDSLPRSLLKNPIPLFVK